MKRLLPVLMGFALLLLSSTEGWSADFQKGFNALERGDFALERGDFAAALREWRPLAEQGNAPAQTQLGAMYRAGQGVPQDYKTAVKWVTLAAEQGYAQAQSNLGVMYGKGEGVIQDKVYAHMWGNLAASNGNENGRKVRTIAAIMMTPAQIAEAQKLARECIRKKYKGC